jgi:hypothetical protein
MDSSKRFLLTLRISLAVGIFLSSLPGMAKSAEHCYFVLFWHQDITAASALPVADSPPLVLGVPQFWPPYLENQILWQERLANGSEKLEILIYASESGSFAQQLTVYSDGQLISRCSSYVNFTAKEALVPGACSGVIRSKLQGASIFRVGEKQCEKKTYERRNER